MTILGPQNLTQVRCDTHICLKTTFEGKRVTCRNLFNKRNSHILTDPTLNNWRFYCIIYLYLTLYSLFSLFRDGFIETWERELKFSIIIHECPKIGIYAEIPSKYKNLKKKHQSNSNNTTKSINHCCTEPISGKKILYIFSLNPSSSVVQFPNDVCTSTSGTYTNGYVQNIEIFLLSCLWFIWNNNLSHAF